MKTKTGKIWDDVLSDLEELEKSASVFKKSVERFKEVAEKFIRR